MPAPWDSIDHLLSLDPGRRGIATFFIPGAARRAAEALRGARRVLLTTGFTVADNAPETDGPPGTAVLGHALAQLGARVRYVTDPQNAPILEAALAVLGTRGDIVVYPARSDAAPALLRRERPTHMVAVERPGRGRGGDYLNARGVSVAPWNRPIDELFLYCSDGWVPGSKRRWPVTGARSSAHPSSWGTGARSRPVTIGIGDGGNEIGMGNVHARLSRQGALMARIAAVVSTDHLVVAGVSNWGAYGITAQLSRLTGRSLLHTAAAERHLIEACVKAGAVDGITRRSEPTVDGLDLEVHAAFLRLLGVAADSGMMATSPRPSVNASSSAKSSSRGKASRR
jgi:hypothetical protein